MASKGMPRVVPPVMRLGIVARLRGACILACLTSLTPAAVLAARPDEVTPAAAAEPQAQRPVRAPATLPGKPPGPAPATRPAPIPSSINPVGDANAKAAQPQRLKRINAAKSWGYQLNGLRVEEAVKSPFDLIIADATSGHAAGRHFQRGEVELLKKKTDGSRRLVLSYLSIGEAEDYRPDYFSPEYLTEDAPDWLMHENPQWKGNRIIRFCQEGWQRSILGDDDGRSVYNSIDPSPLYRLMDLGFDGIYLDRVDVYSEVAKACPDSARKMVEFVARLAAHARKRDPNFLVILQNAEELVRNPLMMTTIDGLAKEDLFYGADHTEAGNGAAAVTEALGHLKAVRAAGRPVFVVDYVTDPVKKADAKKRIEQNGFVPYIAPRDLGSLWLPGKDF